MNKNKPEKEKPRLSSLLGVWGKKEQDQRQKL